MSVPFLSPVEVQVPLGSQYVGSVAGANSAGIYLSNGSPEGVVSANPGSLCQDITGNLYQKTSGTGNTGWTILAAGAGTTNLTNTPSPTGILVESSTGTDTTLPGADGTNAGLLLPGDFTKLGHIAVTQAVDLDAMETDISEHQTLLGVADGSTDLGTFTGTTIADNVAIKAALQSLETAVEARVSNALTSGQILVGNGSNVAAAVAMSGDATIDNAGVVTVAAASDTAAGKVELATPAEVLAGTDTARAVTAAGVDGYFTALVGNAAGVQHLGTFTGTTIADNATVKAALQALETAVENVPSRVQTVVADIAARDALVGSASGDLVWVIDASADATVTAGGAMYIYNGSAWVKVSEAESLDVVTNLSVANATITTLDILSSTGSDATIPAAVPDTATGANDGTAGLLSSADKLKLNRLNSYAANYGDGTATTFALNHNLGSLDVVVNVYRVSDGVQVLPQIARTSVNQVTLTHSIAPTANQYRVVVSRSAAA